MPDTKERTTEDKVRRIAEEVVGFQLIPNCYFSEVLGVGYRDDDGVGGSFGPHANTPIGAADREKAMLAMTAKESSTWSHQPYAFDDGTYGWAIRGEHGEVIENRDSDHGTLGLAFIDAVDAWLDARKAEKT